MTTTALRALCIKNDWFNHGSNHQYGKLFDRAAEGASLEELATIIWVCSEDVTREQIIEQLRQIA